MIPHIWLRKGRKRYLLLKDETSFHVIDGDKNLTKENESLLLEHSHTSEQMRQMGLSGQTFLKERLQGVAVYGCAKGDDLEFHFGRKKQGWLLAQRYEPQYLDQFFRGVPRIRTPGKRLVKGGKNRDWRSREIDPAVSKQMRVLGIGTNVSSVLMCVGILFLQNRVPREWLLAAGFVCAAFGAFLGVVHQEYFTFLDAKDYRSAGGRSKVSHLWGLPLLMLLLALTGFRWYLFFDLSPVIVVGGTLGLVAGLLGLAVIADFRNSIGHGICCVLLCIILGAGTVGHFNHLLASRQPQIHTPVIVEMWVSRHAKGSDSYICRVQFPDGRELQVNVGKNAYGQYEIGDSLEVQVCTGAFGIEYGYLW